MLLKYGHLMLPAGYILDLYCIPYCENYTELYFDPKNLEKGWKRRDEIFGDLFS